MLLKKINIEGVLSFRQFNTHISVARTVISHSITSPLRADMLAVG